MPRIIPEYKEEVRKKIVDTAYDLFKDRGYHGTTMEDIAGALGVTKPAIYQYFPGKEDLFAAVSERGRQELKGILEQSYRGCDIRSGSGALFDSLSRNAPQFYGIFSEMMLLAPRNGRIRRILEEDRQEDLLVIERFIARQRDNGLISPRLDPHALALASHAIIGGLLLDMSTGLDKEEAKRIWVFTVESLMKSG
jgi:AcrR family transcriptional regulator